MAREQVVRQQPHGVLKFFLGCDRDCLARNTFLHLTLIRQKNYFLDKLTSANN